MNATSGLVPPETMERVKILWKKGSNMFQSFFTEVDTIRRQIGNDELFASWCFWQLHIDVATMKKMTAALRDADSERVKQDLAEAAKAERERVTAERHAERLNKIRLQNEIDAEKAKNVAWKLAEEKARLEAERAKAAAEKAAKKADKKPTRKYEKTTEKLERAKAEILADPMAKRDVICERARVNHAIEQEAHSQLEQQGLVPPRNTGWTKGPPKPDDYMLYNGYVEAGKAAANHQWTLGDLAISVTALKSYGEAKLANYADDVGVEHSSLKVYMAVAKAWPEKVIRITFSVCQVLMTHPDRVAIVAAVPNMTVAKAREIMDAWKATTNVVALRGA